MEQQAGTAGTVWLPLSPDQDMETPSPSLPSRGRVRSFGNRPQAVDQKREHASRIVRAVVVGRHAQPGNRRQQLVRIDVRTDLPCIHRRLKKPPKSRPQPQLEVPGQGIKGRVSRVQGGGKSALGSNQVRVPLHPPRQRLAGRIPGSQGGRSVRTGVQLVTEDSRDEIGTLGKMAVDGTDAKAGLLGNLPHGSVYSRDREHLLRRLEQHVEVALRVGTHPACSVTARRPAVFSVFFSTVHRALAKRNNVPYFV